MSYTTLTPNSAFKTTLSWVLISTQPTEGTNVLLAPTATQNIQVKNIYTFYTFSFCLLKIVLQILASFDIKITIVCKRVQETDGTQAEATQSECFRSCILFLF